MSRAIVVDVGSNSIKCLVARRNEAGVLEPVWEKTLPVRISAGISDAHPLLGPSAIEAALEAIAHLIESCRPHGSTADARIVATSAVRDAKNGPAFARQVFARTNRPLQVLSGEEEANLIARGIAEDPSLRDSEDPFCAADLGGGSLELVRITQGMADPAISLQLGTVRLIEALLIDARAPLVAEKRELLQNHIRTAIAASQFPLQAPLVGTGGVITVWRAISAAAAGRSFAKSSPQLTRADLAVWIERFGRISWEERLAVPGLPPARADIIPAGLVIIDTLLEIAAAEHLTHSFYNLRYGLAAQILS